VRQKIEEKKRLEDEIQKAGMILEDKCGYPNHRRTQSVKRSVEDARPLHRKPRRFASVLQTIDRVGKNPRKIINELEHIESLKQERRLKKNCGMWESRAARFNEIVPMCEQVLSRGDRGISLLMGLQAAVLKKIEVDEVSKKVGLALFTVFNYILIRGYNSSNVCTN